MDEQLKREILAQMALQRQGSVMAKPRDTRSPLVGTVGDLLEALNPINWMGGMGGASSAVIAPTGNKILQGLLEALRSRAPGLVGKAEDTARTVFPYLHPGNPASNAVGTYQSLNPLAGNVNVSGMQSKEEMLSTFAHELRHFLTDPTLATKNPAHAAETATQITNMLPQTQQHAMQHYLSTQAPGFYSHYQGPAEQVLQRTAGGTHGVNPATISNPLRAYNESLSYLTEALLSPETRKVYSGADPALDAVANALGQGLK